MKTKTTRNKLLAKLHVLVSQRGIDKEEYLYNNFGGRSSARELSDEELVRAVAMLEDTGRNGQAHAPSASGLQAPLQNTSTIATCINTNTPAHTAEEIRKMRSEILSLLTKSPSALNLRQRGLGVPNDWTVLNPWIERHSGGLRLNQMDYTHLQWFKRQLLAIRKKGWFYREPVAEVIVKEKPTPTTQQTTLQPTPNPTAKPITPIPLTIRTNVLPS